MWEKWKNWIIFNVGFLTLFVASEIFNLPSFAVVAATLVWVLMLPVVLMFLTIYLVGLYSEDFEAVINDIAKTIDSRGPMFKYVDIAYDVLVFILLIGFGFPITAAVYVLLNVLQNATIKNLRKEYQC